MAVAAMCTELLSTYGHQQSNLDMAVHENRLLGTVSVEHSGEYAAAAMG